MPRGAVANIRRSRAPFAAPAGGLTPPTVRDRTSYASAATETSAAVPIPASAQAGDVHYIFCELTASAGAITTPTGYTAVVPQFDSESSTSAESACFRKDTTLSGGGGTVTISFSSGRFAAASLAVQDVDTSVFEDVAGASDNGPAAGTTSVDAPSLTPANAGTLLLTGDLVFEDGFNLNGIAAAKGGRVLVVVQTNTGKLFTVHPRTGLTGEIDLGGATVTNGDGLLLLGRHLFVVRNQRNLIAVVKLSRSLSSGRVVAELTDPDLDVPTTIAFTAGHLYAVNARFGTAPDPPTARYDIVRVSLDD